MPPLIAPILQFFLTIYYFFYFLAKGKPEWKCPNEKHGGDSWNVKKVCCDGDVMTPKISSTDRGIYGKINDISSMIRQYSIQFVQWFKRIPHSIARNIGRLGTIMKRMSTSIVSLFVSAWQIISTFFSTLFSFILFRRAPSKSMPTSEVIYSSEQEMHMNIPSLSFPSTPVPYSPSSSILSSPPPPPPSSSPPSSSPPSHPPPPPPPPPPSRSTRVPSSHKEEVNDNEISMMNKEEETPWKGGAFYTTRVFDSNQENGGRKNIDLNVNGEAIKGGIPVFPPSIMAEIAGSGGGASNQVNRSEINRTPNRTVKERLRDASLTPTHTSTFEYPNEILPLARNNLMELTKNNWRVDAPKGWEKSYGDREIRSKSVGPPRVSRMEDSLNNEAQFIFRAHGSDEDSRDNYTIGRREWNSTNMMERMDDKMNKQMEWRPSTPSIWSCNTSRISSPSFNIREDEYGVRKRGRVGESARSWPPPTNAQGAEIGKNYFIDGDGIITTASTRIVQKKNEESWRWLDDNGLVIDEQKEFSLMGDTDEVKRHGPYQADQYSQHYFVDRNGTIKFENTHRQYDKDYVIESVCKNY